VPFINTGVGVPNTPMATVKSFQEIPVYFPERNFTITGVTKDSSGAALGGCTVKLFNRATDAKEQETVSDGSGNYSFIVSRTQTYYVVAYLPGSPDVAGTTLNTLAGV
jgi:hypothetical protein